MSRLLSRLLLWAVALLLAGPGLLLYFRIILWLLPPATYKG